MPGQKPRGARRSLTLLFSPVQCTIAWLCVASPLSTNDVLMSETCAGEAAPATGAARAQRPWLAAGAPSSLGPGAGPGAPDPVPRACPSSPPPGSTRPADGLGGDRTSQARGPRRAGSGERPATPQAARSSSSSRSGRGRGGGGAPELGARVAGPGPFGARGCPRCAMVAEGRRRGGAGEGRPRPREREGAEERERERGERSGRGEGAGGRRGLAAQPTPTRRRARTATCRPARARGGKADRSGPGRGPGARPSRPRSPSPPSCSFLPPPSLPVLTEHLLWASHVPGTGNRGTTAEVPGPGADSLIRQTTPEWTRSWTE